jgi:hypothetical protein
MPRARRRPTLAAPLGPEGRKRLAEKIAGIHERGDAARAKLAAATGRPEGRADTGRIVRTLTKPDPLERSIARAEANAVHLANLGNRADAARAERTATGLKTKLAKRQRAQAFQREQEAGRASRLDRFALLVKRSEVLTEAHYAIADRWLAALDAAADGEMARPAAPAGEPDEPEGVLPPPSGPAIFLSGASVLDRWTKAVPVEAVASGRRKKPETFDPKRVKAARRAPQQGPVHGVQVVAHDRRCRAEKITQVFVSGVTWSGHPEWCAAVAIRVILQNQTLTHAFEALGITYGEKNLHEAQTAMASGLAAISPLVNKSVF